jgi:hypothetical protein
MRWMELIVDQLVRIGGRNAQREVFADTLPYQPTEGA